jgi:hypothetical protein
MTKKLHLSFHGRIIDQLGSQTYQSPVASLAELVANAWDADAKKVEIFLPDSDDDGAEIIIRDDGIGLSFDECEKKYLKIGWCKRGNDPKALTPGGRPVLGRKGIGKFAGFGIAKIINVETVSKDTGEKTSFEMNLDNLTGDKYMEQGGEIEAQYHEPDKERSKKHGTTVTLKSLTLERMISKTQFPMSMARRFLLHQTASDFEILVDNKPIPKSEDLSKVEFTFPKDYERKEIPDGMTTDKEWGVETLPNGRTIKWKAYFFEDTINDEELQGITIFSNGKLAQKPFFFNLSGGLGGQAGQSYMSGQVIADYIDQLPVDPMSAERQRINWELPETAPLLDWGQERVKKLLKIWHDRRGDKRRKELEEKVAGFSDRLEKLPPYESKTVRRVLTKLGGIPTLTREQFYNMGEAILTSWEQGRLRDLMTELSEKDDLSEKELLKILIEAETISALNIAEAIKTKLLAIANLKDRIDKKELETTIRDHISSNPWIISPKWETFKVETSVKTLISEISKEVGFADDIYKGRVDLVLASGDHMLVLEFMRPGLSINWDHADRFNRYVRTIRTTIESNTAGRFKRVTGYIVADKIEEDPVVRNLIKSMAAEQMFAADWQGLLSEAKSSWTEYLEILVKRGKGDKRLQSLLD